MGLGCGSICKSTGLSSSSGPEQEKEGTNSDSPMKEYFMPHTPVKYIYFQLTVTIKIKYGTRKMNVTEGKLNQTKSFINCADELQNNK